MSVAETDSRILEYLEEGLFLYGVGKVQESIARWRKVLELDPKNERAMDYIESAGGDVSAFRARAAGAAGPVGSVAQPAPAPAAAAPPAPARAPSPAPAPAPAPAAASNPWATGSWDAPVAPLGADPWATTPSAPVPPQSAPAPPAPQWQPAPPRPGPVAAPPPKPATPPPTSAPASASAFVPGKPAPAPRGLPAPETREDLLAKAAALYRAKYYEAALELFERIAREHPPVDETLQGYLDAARTGMAETLKTQWSRTDLVPRPRLGPAQIMQLKLSPEAGFMLSRIDGMSSVDDIISMAGLDQFTALRALNSLLQLGAIELTQQ